MSSMDSSRSGTGSPPRPVWTMKKKKKKDEGFFDEDDLRDCRRFIAGLVAGLFTTVLVLAFVVFAKRIFLLGGAESYTLVQHLQRIQVLVVDTTARWGKEFQSIFEELYA